MLYAKIINGGVAEYPCNPGKIRLDNPGTSFPSELPDSLLAEYGVLPVTAAPRPANTLTQDAVEQTPQLINGVWTQVWSMVDVSPEIAAQRALDAADQAAADTVTADAFVQNFIAMTPAQVESYVANNTANLAQVRTLMGKMALMLLILARQQYR